MARKQPEEKATGSRKSSQSRKSPQKIPAWSPYKAQEVEKLIVKYAKAGKPQAEIGRLLRDNYGVGSIKAMTGRKAGNILQEHGIAKKLPEDMLSLIRKVINVKHHLEQNHKDQTARRGLLLTASKLRKLVNYYRSSGKLPRDWTLDMERLKMYLE